MIVVGAIFFFLAGATLGGMLCYELGAKYGAWRYGWRK